MSLTYVLFGTSSDIAKSYVRYLAKTKPLSHVICISSKPNDFADLPIKVTSLYCDYSEQSLKKITNKLKTIVTSLNQVIVFNGLLHYDNHAPEKKIEDIDANYFNTLMKANSLTPILCIQAILPLLSHNTPCTITALSARIGSINDNQLGGWYSYRASKAALNMLFKTAAIEITRRAKNTQLVLFHPGTTDTKLSKPFQKNINKENLLTPDFVAQSLFAQLQNLSSQADSNNPAYIDFNGQPISW
ncbi:SDR family NAD(P)-dependent oxidoreductase [Pseudoalteromonas sp. MMG010]|uniref:SDR family NAD(P)-dependent oxidoreductase n=1 Tax=Pseudoalteromonas sp. MMG010 TaxID=2822685 RepID=UPI001B39FD6F|nr:SDR family NAD(P)-dependent oxidoreductase [Pseudoalteromonas sp. MMG010]MBQ4833386.1 SDR family NAD(P)-dependent oxidoreductase [Pseudoalteromonas sp. MMG010]